MDATDADYSLELYLKLV